MKKLQATWQKHWRASIHSARLGPGPMSVMALLVMVFLVGWGLSVLPACHRQPIGPEEAFIPRWREIREEPIVRVRVVRGVSVIELKVDQTKATYLVCRQPHISAGRDTDRPPHTQQLPASVRVESEGGFVTVRDGRGRVLIRSNQPIYFEAPVRDRLGRGHGEETETGAWQNVANHANRAGNAGGYTARQTGATVAVLGSVGENVGGNVVRSVGGGIIMVQGRAYGGKLAIVPRAGLVGTFDVINHIGLESYLPGVLEGELYKHWHAEAFAAQAVAARSYAIYIAQQRRRQRGKDFDLEATTASQMYHGANAHSKALDAVRRTRGLILTYNELLVPTFYSSCSGGTSQDAWAVFPNAPKIPPLQGRDHGHWGASSQRFHWGPVFRDTPTLRKRFVAWGKSRGHAIAKLGSITDVAVSRRNSVGRPIAFTIRDARGQQFELNAEAFRLACNQNAEGLPRVKSETRLYSAYVTPRMVGPTQGGVQFEDGRGHGHGVGLDQYGTQEMASKGYNAASILAFYYPDSVLRRAY